MDLLILLISVVALIGIFARKYMITAKGISMRNIIFHSNAIKKKKEEEVERDRTEQRSTVKVPPKVAPKSVEAKMVFSKAMTYYDRGQLEDAEKQFIQVIALDKDFKDASHRLGLIYLKQGQFGKAEAIFKQLSTDSEHDPVYHSNLGRALFEQEKFEEALDSYLKAIELDDSRPGRYVSVAEVYRHLGDNDKAQAMYKKALDLDPSNVDYLLTFAHFLIEEKKSSQARFYIEKVLKLQPDNHLALEMMKEVGE